MESRIYFIQGEGGGPIKIGVSADIPGRLKAMQTGSPVKLILLAHAPGSVVTEFELHELFAAHRLSGEWFSPHADILNEIAAIKEHIDQTIMVPTPPVKPQEAIDKDARQKRFLSDTLAAALPVAYGRAPGWKTRAAHDADVTATAIRFWIDGSGRLPALASVVNFCRRNQVMYFWFLSCTAACWLADELGVTEMEALQAVLAQPEIPKKLWKTRSNESLARLLRKTWKQYQASNVQPSCG